MAVNEVKAILTAEDRSFTSTMKAAAQQTGLLDKSMGKTVKAGALMRLGMLGVDKAVTVVSSHIGSAVDRFDTMQKFPKVMAQMGFSADDAERAIQKLSKGVEGLPTALDEITKNAQSIALLTGDLDGATDLAISLNNAFLASGSSSADAARGLTQYTQMLSSGKVDMQSWKTLLETMSPALTKVAKSFGFTGKSAKNDLYKALQDGTITFDELNAKLIELNGGVDGFAATAKTQSTGIRTSFQNIGTAVTKGLASMIETVQQAAQDSGLGSIADIADRVKGRVNRAFESMNAFISQIDFKGIIEAAKPYWDAFTTVLTVVASALGTVATFMAQNAGVITKVAIPLALLVATWSKLATVFTIIKGPMALLTSGFSKLAGGILAKLAPQLVTTAAAETTAGTAASTASTSMLKLGAAVLMIGGGLALAGLGFSLMAQAAIALAGAGGAAIGVMVGMVAVLGGLMVLVSALGPALFIGAAGMLAFGAAILLMGAGVLIAAAGLRLMATAIPVIAKGGAAAAKGVLLLATASVALGAASAATVTATAALGALALAALAAGKATSSGSKGFLKLRQGAVTAVVGLRLFAVALRAIAPLAIAAGRAIGTGFVNALKTAKTGATAAGKAAGQGAVKGMRTQKASAVSVGKDIAQGLVNGLKAKQQAAYNAGVAAGKAYNRGLKTTEKSHSPAKVTMGIGKDIGQGLVLGLQAKNKQVAKMGALAAQMYNNALSPMGMAFAGGLSDNYNYGSGSYEITVPLTLNGREIARASVGDMQTALNQRENRQSRKVGIR